MHPVKSVLTGFLGLLIAVLLQARFLPVFGWRVNLTLAALITLAYFWNPLQMVFWSAIATIFLGWHNFFSTEILLVFLIPQFVFVVRKILPWQGWLNNLASILISLAVFDLAVAGPFLFLKNYDVVLKDAAAMLVFGAMFFQLMRTQKK